MKIIAAAVLAALLSTGAQAAPKPPPAERVVPTDDQRIRQIVERWRVAFEKKDANAVMSIYSRDVVAYDLVPPLQYVGFEAYRRNYQDFFDQYTGPIRVELRGLHVAAGDTVAVAFMLERVTGKLKSGEPSDIWLRATQTYRKGPDGR
jgi:ketosteroid isomerase-like protein